MKIVPFPTPDDERDGDAVATQIEAALHGEAGGEAAEHWRELRADVRSLAPTMSPEFERRLQERVAEWASAPESSRARLFVRTSRARAGAWFGAGMQGRLFAVGGACAVAAVLVLVLAAPWRASQSGSALSSSSGREDFVPAEGPVKAGAQTSPSSGAASAGATAKSETVNVEPTKVLTPAAGGGVAQAQPSSSSRVQQRAASITLAPKPEAVQSVADQVAQLASRDGGFVQSSQVRLQRGAGGEANVQLSLPSARLSAALAELARLAPTPAQSTSLQDITYEYGAARAKLADALAERQALLRALSKASTQGEIESLRTRLGLLGGDIVKDRAALASVSKRGGTATVEVTVLGDARAGSERSTLENGLHDAGDVLKVSLAVALVALAVLVPLALIVALAALGWRASRRRVRERALS